MPSFDLSRLPKILAAVICALTPALLPAAAPYTLKPGLPEFAPALAGMSATIDSGNATPSAVRIPIAVSRTIDPSGQHPVAVLGTTRDLVWSGTTKRAALDEQLRAALAADDYKILLDAKSKRMTRLTAKKNADLDETWVTMTVKDGVVDLHSVRSQILKLRNLGEAPLTPAEIELVMLRLDPPAPTPEPITAVDDFPYLRHIPGLDLLVERSRSTDGPFLVVLDNKDVTVDGPVLERYYYQGPTPVSTFRSLIAYREGLTRAGWEIVRTETGLFSSTVELYAHYQKEAREVWAHISIAPDNEKIRVADSGTLDIPFMTRRLTTDGKLVLYGIHFDGEGKLIPQFKGLVDRLAPALQEAGKGGARYSVVAHVEEGGGVAAATQLANAVVRELLARGVATDLVDAKGKNDLPDRSAPRLPNKAYFEILKK